MEFFWCAGTTPILEKTLRECRGKWTFFGWVRGHSGNRSESCSENCGFRIDQVVRGHSENGISYSENGISNSESCSENTPELSESSENGLSLRERFSWNWGGPQASEFWKGRQKETQKRKLLRDASPFFPALTWTSLSRMTSVILAQAWACVEKGSLPCEA